MIPKVKLPAVAGLIVLAAVSYAFGGGVLRFTAKVGSVHKYKGTVRTTIQGQSAVITGYTKHTVTKVASNGDITIMSADSDTSVKINGKVIPIPQDSSKGQSGSVTRPDGTVASIIGSDTSSDRYRGETLNTVELPNFPLAVGKSWVWNCAANPKTGAVKARGEYKVVASERIHGIDTWKISTKVVELTGAKPGSIIGFCWVSKSDATPVKVTYSGKNLPIGGANGPIDGSLVIEMIS